jgi:hypothetical protein
MFWVHSQLRGGVTQEIDKELGVAIERTSDEGGRADAQQIAAWHPGVALLVADWLEATAAEFDIDSKFLTNKTARGLARALRPTGGDHD